jgi:hypothetical protein
MPSAIDLFHYHGDGRVIVTGNFTQAVPEYVFQRHAGLMSIDDDGALDNFRLLSVFELVHQSPAIHYNSLCQLRDIERVTGRRGAGLFSYVHLPSPPMGRRIGTILLQRTSDQPTPLRRQGNANA